MDTAAKKRKAYFNAVNNPDGIHIVNPSFELMAKTDEH